VGDLSDRKLSWQGISIEDAASLSDEQLRDYLPVIDQKLERLCNAIQHLMSNGRNYDFVTMDFILNPPLSEIDIEQARPSAYQ